jgi:hypothetical protein
VRHNSDVVSQSAETIKFRFRIHEQPILNLRVSKRNGPSSGKPGPVVLSDLICRGAAGMTHEPLRTGDISSST